MHFVVSWDIPASTPNRAETESKLISCFSKYTYEKPLTTFYLIKANTQIEYATILSNLQEIGKTISGIRMVISPIMNGGRYDGIHVNSTWTNINNISG